MAQYMHDGGQQHALPLPAYHPDWFASSASYGAQHDTFNQQHAILDSSDSALLNNFWNNPDSLDTAMASSDVAFAWYDMDQKLVNGDVTSQLEGFNSDAQTIQNPAMTLAGNPSPHFHTHSNNHHHPFNLHTDMLGIDHGQSSDDEVKAASNLFSLSNQGLNGSANSWGTFGPAYPSTHVQEMVKSPNTSSGRQSANSYHSQHHNHLSTNSFHNSSTQQQPQHFMDHQYHWPQQQQQQQQMQMTPRAARPNSLQLDAPPANFYQASSQMPAMHSAMPYDSAETRPPPVRFGSDNNFGSYGFRGPKHNVTLEHTKGANLNNVPFAAQAAANGQGHMPPFTPMTQHLPHQSYPAPSQARAFQNNSTDSSPSVMGGLPVASPASSINRHGHPFQQNPMAPRSAIDDRSEEDIEYEEQKPPKRRKSQMQRDDDADYSPSGHVKTPVLKRGSKAVKIPNVNGSDDDYTAGPPTKPTTKRRKSSAAARNPLDSSESASPPAMASPNGKHTSSGKKKSRGSQARQNLTEDEKRRNHIQSEKTRRDLIRVQYDELDILVPALKSGRSGLSRSDILKEIVAYVESVAQGNEAAIKALDSGAGDTTSAAVNGRAAV